MQPAVDPALFDLFIGECADFSTACNRVPAALGVLPADPLLLAMARRRLLALRSAAGVVPLPLVAQLATLLEVQLRRLTGTDPGAAAAQLPLQRRGWQVLLDFSANPSVVGAEAAGMQAVVESLRQPAASAAEPPNVPLSDDERRMLQLFQQEVEEHAGALARGLMLLEAQPQQRSLIEPLMRAAHSVKGAARAVRLEAGVQLAHQLEDHLAAIARGELPAEPERIELLLKISDHLHVLARGLEQMGVARVDPASLRLLDALIEDRDRDAAVRALPVDTQPGGGDSAQREPEVAAARGESALRVQGEHISELLGLAASGLVESRVALGFGDDLRQLRSHGNKLSELFDELHRELGTPSLLDPLGARLAQLRHHLVDARRLLSSLGERVGDHGRRSEELHLRLYRGAMRVRMRPLKDALIGFPRMVRDLARRLSKQVRLNISGDHVLADRDILQRLEAPLSHLLRNALDHGVESAEQRLVAGKPAVAELLISAGVHAGLLRIHISDDGAGIDPERVRRRLLEEGGDATQVSRLDRESLYDQLFNAGFSTASSVTEVSGRGVGLDVVRNSLHEMGGSVRIQSELGRGTRFELLVPVSRAVVRTVAVEVAGECYGFPLARIERLLDVPLDELRAHSHWQFIHLGRGNLALLSLAALLELGDARFSGSAARAVMIDDRGKLFGFVVDRVIGEFDLAVRPIDARLGRIANLSAAAILPDGAPLLLLDVDDLLRSAERMERSAPRPVDAKAAGVRRRRVLVVDDSVSVRELERQLLKGGGYEVEIAADGLEGWNTVREQRFDLVITDVDMPRMSGIELTRSIKQDPGLRQLPVIIVSYRDRPEDRQRGLEARADSYLTKSDFHDQRFLDVVQDLIGGAEVQE